MNTHVCNLEVSAPYFVVLTLFFPSFVNAPLQDHIHNMQELTKKRERLIAKTALKKRENDLIEEELSGLEVTVAERAHIHEAIGSMNT